MDDNRAANFIKYNNAVPVVIGALLLSTGGAFAATNPAVQEAIVSADETVQSVDNTFLLSVDFEDYPFIIEIQNIQEDDDSYYALYALTTVQLDDFVWKEVVATSTLEVHKSLLRGDLGVHLAEELEEVRYHERVRLTKIQAEEKEKGETQKNCCDRI